ncbi:ComF family protein [Streptomyces sp. NPDC051561]|uniref:ComF family protein n=1 Tax=Streptomyces sp. NPDC051561 TaxID=3365658 RepID=UPI00379DD1B8
MRGWWREFAGLVLPVACGGCGRGRVPEGVCGECAEELYGGGAGRVRPDPEPGGLPVVHAAARYEDATRAVLLAHKERGALGLARPLGVALAGAVRGVVAEVGGACGGVVGVTGGVVGGGGGVAYSWGVGVGGAAVNAMRELVLVPVPSARRSVGARGHDAARRIAFAAAGELRRGGIAARVAPVLRQRRPVGDQAGLGARERPANLSGALDLVAGGHRLLAGGRTVLVDDLMTTGASLTEAARAIGAAGALDPGAAGAGRGPEPKALGVARSGCRNAGEPAVVAAVVAAPPLSFEINWN